MFISQKLVELIERNADNLSKRWLEEVKNRPDTMTYHTFDPDQLYRRAHEVYSQLGKWISRETTKEDIARIYIALGKERRKEGFALSEVIMALILTRRVLWLKVLSDGLLDTALELHQALELNNRLILFFDRAIHFIALGYEEEKEGRPASARLPQKQPAIGYRIVATIKEVKGTCSAGHRPGETFEISCYNPAGLCGFWYHQIFPDLSTFQFGGSLPWWKGDVIEVHCPDLQNLVTLRLERFKRK